MVFLNKNYSINESNKGIFDAICSVFKIDSIDFSDIVLEISKVRLKQYRTIDDNFDSLLSLNNIPDIFLLYLEDNLSISDIMKLRSTSEFKAFKQWFFDNKDKPTESELIKAYYLATKQQSKLDSIPVRTYRSSFKR